MKVFDFLALQDPRVTPARVKLHCACWNGIEHPRDVYVAGGFDEWQRWQSKRNFSRPYVLALLQLPTTARWLYAGVYAVNGVAEPPPGEKYYHYDLSPLPSCAEFAGRLVVQYDKRFRTHPTGERAADDMTIAEILPARMSISDFPGYRMVDISKRQLDVIVAGQLEGWRTALSVVGGVYLITDTTTGQLYVGSAQGGQGLWQRWCEYASTGHGGNRDLCALLGREGPERCGAFRFSILEIADLGATDVLDRESHWKRILNSRQFGLNAN